MSDLYSLSPAQIVLYGVNWCPDCKRARRVFAAMSVNFLDVDVDADPQAAAFIKQVNHGTRSVPTILFPDGSRLTEPDDDSLIAKLKNFQQTA